MHDRRCGYTPFRRIPFHWIPNNNSNPNPNPGIRRNWFSEMGFGETGRHPHWDNSNPRVGADRRGGAKRIPFLGSGRPVLRNNGSDRIGSSRRGNWAKTSRTNWPTIADLQAPFATKALGAGLGSDRRGNRAKSRINRPTIADQQASFATYKHSEQVSITTSALVVYKSKHIFLPFRHNARVWQTDRILIVMQTRQGAILLVCRVGIFRTKICSAAPNSKSSPKCRGSHVTVSTNQNLPRDPPRPED